MSLDVVEPKCERKIASTMYPGLPGQAGLLIILHTLVFVACTVGSNPFKTCAACTDATLCPCWNAIKRFVWALSPTPLVSRPAG
ncbi:unnamed protein product [Fusarium venenatum]|uniref:Uncharacterized protein n=1 Tax=Fusarium venenatum TaxID=56646 RepID=A0A2L2T024_9HYPO|nr:LOW QUALITY PROTEIN: uncharacterized protein FVRRES_11944 [Fusarium venenatum]CEI39253.1 unnamed protein product [Fusarium venenatum]